MANIFFVPAFIFHSNTACLPVGRFRRTLVLYTFVELLL
jgi:hypothetical protein